jgi:hypothetical protein
MKSPDTVHLFLCNKSYLFTIISYSNVIMSINAIAIGIIGQVYVRKEEMFHIYTDRV